MRERGRYVSSYKLLDPHSNNTKLFEGACYCQGRYVRSYKLLDPYVNNTKLFERGLLSSRKVFLLPTQWSTQWSTILYILLLCSQFRTVTMLQENPIRQPTFPLPVVFYHPSKSKGEGDEWKAAPHLCSAITISRVIFGHIAFAQ